MGVSVVFIARRRRTPWEEEWMAPVTRPEQEAGEPYSFPRKRGKGLAFKCWVKDLISSHPWLAREMSDLLALLSQWRLF